MPDPSAGLRDRLVEQSFQLWLYDHLETLGWFTPSPNRKPVVFRGEPFPDKESIPLNGLVVGVEEIVSIEAEVGSTLAEYRHEVWVDFYAESKAVATHLIGDVLGLLAAGPNGDDPAFPIIRWDQPPTDPDPWPTIGYCTVEEPSRERQVNRSDARDTRFWYAARAVLVEFR